MLSMLLWFRLQRHWRRTTARSFPTRRSSDLHCEPSLQVRLGLSSGARDPGRLREVGLAPSEPLYLPEPVEHHGGGDRSEEHTSELQSLAYPVSPPLLEKKHQYKHQKGLT